MIHHDMFHDMFVHRIRTAFNATVMQLSRNLFFMLSNFLLSNGLLERIFDELDLRGRLSFAM